MEPRKDFGEHIPGARKRDYETTLTVLEDLATMSRADVKYPDDVVISKLTEIRRDHIWGSLNSRLTELYDQEASPALALAWRVLYRSVAASAASTDLKPQGATTAVSVRNAYVFGLLYEMVLTRVASEMEQISLDATWPTITQTTCLGGSELARLRAIYEGPTDWPPLAAPNTYTAWSSVRDAIAAITGRSENEGLSLRDTVESWLDGESIKGEVLLGLVRAKGHPLDRRLFMAKSDVLNECAPAYETHVHRLVDNFPVASFCVDSTSTIHNWLECYVMTALAGGYYHARFPQKASFTGRGEDPIAVGDKLAQEVYARIALDPDFNPFAPPRSKQTSTTKTATIVVERGDLEPFESIIQKKVMPPARFEHLQREVTGDSTSPRVGDVSEAELCNLVPFRGIQYGNWATQAERQEMLNLAYDAMSDLALALGVSTRYLALPLTLDSGVLHLGLALGARGRGGNAHAHYEPAQHVINLTKTKGGGALAHEWMHAYDHKVASDLHLGCNSASEIAGNPVYEFMETLRQAVPEGHDQALASAVTHRRDVMLLTLLPPDTEMALVRESGGSRTWQAVGDAMSETIAKWASDPRPVMTYACTGSRIDYEVVTANMESGLVEHGVPAPTAHTVAALWSSRTSGTTWIKLHRALSRDPTLRRGQSEYLAQAQLLNGAKTTGYWTTPTELFARAGSAVVFDRLGGLHGIANGFLAESSNPKRFDPARHKGNPNPAGVEREVFAKAFSKTLLLQMQAEDEYAQDPQQEVVVGLKRQMRLF